MGIINIILKSNLVKKQRIKVYKTVDTSILVSGCERGLFWK